MIESDAWLRYSAPPPPFSARDIASSLIAFRYWPSPSCSSRARCLRSSSSTRRCSRPPPGDTVLGGLPCAQLHAYMPKTPARKPAQPAAKDQQVNTQFVELLE